MRERSIGRSAPSATTRDEQGRKAPLPLMGQPQAIEHVHDKKSEAPKIENRGDRSRRVKQID
jgi:hypothetical protein